MPKNKVFKIVIGGDGGIGKTTLTKVFCNNTFIDQIMTIGVDIHSKKASVNGEDQVLQIWDLSGQEHFEFLLENFARNAHGFVIAFDASRYSSFENLPKWIKLFRKSSPKAPIFLITTRIDKGFHPTLNCEAILEFVKVHNLLGHAETSAKDFINVDVPWRRLLEYLNGIKPGTAKIVYEGDTRQFERGISEGIRMTACEEKAEDVKQVKTEVSNHTFPEIPSQNVPQTIVIDSEKSRCPNCHSLLRDSQIRLRISGNKVLCQNCLATI